jgi:hypothetical protein
MSTNEPLRLASSLESTAPAIGADQKFCGQEQRQDLGAVRRATRSRVPRRTKITADWYDWYRPRAVAIDLPRFRKYGPAALWGVAKW